MMQQWADYLDKLKAGAEVIRLHDGAAQDKGRAEENTPTLQLVT